MVFEKFYLFKVFEIMFRFDIMFIVIVDFDFFNVFKFFRMRYYVWVVKDRESMKFVGVICYMDVIDIFFLLEFYRFKFGMMSRSMRFFFGGVIKVEDVVDRYFLMIEEEVMVFDVFIKMRCYKV